MGKLEQGYIDGEMLNNLATSYAQIEKEMRAEEYCSTLHEPKWLVITKLEGNNYPYSIGNIESGMCKGVEVGKSVLLNTTSRWFRTSIVQSINEDTFRTNNSVYKYEWANNEV